MSKLYGLGLIAMLTAILIEPSTGNPLVIEAGSGELSEATRLVGSEIEDLDLFGVSVDVLGDTAVVGSQGAEAVYVFVRESGSELWQEEATLVPDDTHSGNRFGTSVSLGADGDVVLIGAMEADVGATTAQGAAYIFYREVMRDGSGAWTQWQKLTVNGVTGDRFGSSVSLPANSPDIALIGAPGQTVSGDAERGAAYLFELIDGEFELLTLIQASDGQAGDRFGFSTALSDDPANINGYALIGSHFSTVDEDDQRGAAYVFHRDSSTGFWAEDAKLIDSSGQPGDRLGSSLALNGNGSVAVIGASGAIAGDGAIVMFEADIAGWGQQVKLSGADGLGGIRGLAINSQGDMVLAGSSGEPIDGDTNRGAAYLLKEDPVDGWSVVPDFVELTSSDGQPGDRLGSSVGLSGNTFLAGAPFVDDDGINRGAAYLFEEQLDTIFKDRFDDNTPLPAILLAPKSE